MSGVGTTESPISATERCGQRLNDWQQLCRPPGPGICYPAKWEGFEMRPRCPHPRLVDLSCRLYGVIVATYPESFRREYRRELLLTFRSQAEDILRHPKPGALLH